VHIQKQEKISDKIKDTIVKITYILVLYVLLSDISIIFVKFEVNSLKYTGSPLKLLQQISSSK